MVGGCVRHNVFFYYVGQATVGRVARVRLTVRTTSRGEVFEKTVSVEPNGGL